jgi:enoyl-CoA hydratase/carnithine racemase
MIMSTTSNEPYLHRELENHVLWITLDRPDNRNSLSTEMIQALKSAIDEAGQNAQVRVIVLGANGPVFSSGHHLKEVNLGAVGQDIEAKQKKILGACSEMMLSIVHGPKPVIAMVQGTATAAGCQLVATCDLAVASDKALFCTPGVNIGGFCTTPLVGIGRKIRPNHAMELALTGEMFNAEDAFRFGLINRIVPHEALRKETEKLATLIASKSSQAIKSGKTTFYEQIELPIEEAYVLANQRMVEGNQTADAIEGTKAFFEKRPPIWQDI